MLRVTSLFRLALAKILGTCIDSLSDKNIWCAWEFIHDISPSYPQCTSFLDLYVENLQETCHTDLKAGHYGIHL